MLILTDNNVRVNKTNVDLFVSKSNARDTLISASHCNDRHHPSVENFLDSCKACYPSLSQTRACLQMSTGTRIGWGFQQIEMQGILPSELASIDLQLAGSTEVEVSSFFPDLIAFGSQVFTGNLGLQAKNTRQRGKTTGLFLWQEAQNAPDVRRRIRHQISLWTQKQRQFWRHNIAGFCVFQRNLDARSALLGSITPEQICH